MSGPEPPLFDIEEMEINYPPPPDGLDDITIPE